MGQMTGFDGPHFVILKTLNDTSRGLLFHTTVSFGLVVFDCPSRRRDRRRDGTTRTFKGIVVQIFMCTLFNKLFINDSRIIHDS